MKACPINIFEFKPEYGKVAILSITVLLEVLVIELQKAYGPKFLLPFSLRKPPFDYYISEIQTENATDKEYNVRLKLKIY